ncbi:competence protein CoiA [Dapis sp. BLCC M229]|uniref:competence protein CoiA n=1 Tax=Dapis sp. BLCC M229 TaxID=3400188 RepID=UPI003CF82BBD
MPLRAILDNQELLAPLLSDEQWEELKQKKVQVILPCCEATGYLRNSKLGTKHFAHNKKDGCNYKSETWQHLLCKTEIARACKDMGYEVKTEASGVDWRADVLATKEIKNQLVKLAFEVQWSPQSLEETQQRQHKYIRDGIRCCWLFKKLPILKQREDLPMFQLIEEPENIAVKVNQNSFQIFDFITALLSSHFKFSPFYQYKKQQHIKIRFFPVNCWKCHQKHYIYYVETKPYETICGYNKLIYPPIDKIQFIPEIIDKANEYLKAEEAQRHNIKMGKIKPRYSRKARSSEISFGCYYCDAVFGNYFYPQEIYKAKSSNTQHIDFETTVNIPLENNDIPHWCYSPTKDFCCNY